MVLCVFPVPFPGIWYMQVLQDTGKDTFDSSFVNCFLAYSSLHRSLIYITSQLHSSNIHVNLVTNLLIHYQYFSRTVLNFQQ